MISFYQEFILGRVVRDINITLKQTRLLHVPKKQYSLDDRNEKICETIINQKKKS